MAGPRYHRRAEFRTDDVDTFSRSGACGVVGGRKGYSRRGLVPVRHPGSRPETETTFGQPAVEIVDPILFFLSPEIPSTISDIDHKFVAA